MSISLPDENLVGAVIRFREMLLHKKHREICSIIDENGRRIDAPQFTFSDRRFVFIAATQDHTSATIGRLLRSQRPPSFDDEGILEIIVGVEGLKGGTHANAGLGVRVETLHASLGRLLHLPEGWRQAQMNSLEQTLRPVLVKGKSRAVALLASFGSHLREPAPNWIASYLSWKHHSTKSGKLVYLRAEAGKGKSTTLADLAYSHLESAVGPLPLFVPLRDLERGTGISWNGIAERLGVVEADADHLALAVQSGLVLLILDGLDEVSGRHNPALVKQAVELIIKRASSKNALVIVSGRTTEGSYIDESQAVDVGLELPEVDDSSFSEFIEIVVDDIIPTWLSIAERIPEPLLERTDSLDARIPTKTDKKHIRDWIKAVFDALGKDRSLFFVQGLVCIGRSRQLHGNKPLIIEGNIIETPSIFDVCVLAASLACVREQDKIVSIARDVFTPSKQLDLLTLFSLVASVESGPQGVPTPNELCQRVFDIDPTHQNEEFSAVLHQMQKHALLYSRRVEGAAGDWKPTFLSEWVRNALLIRAWIYRDRLAAYLSKSVNFGLLWATAREAKLAFHEVLPSLGVSVGEQIQIFDTVRMASNEGSPEATSNFWAFVAGSFGESPVGAPPNRIPELTDFSGSEYEGLQFDVGFSGSYVLFNDVEFVNCEFNGCIFNEADFSGATFIGCRLSHVEFNGCHGAAGFDYCEFESCVFSNSRTKREIPWQFYDSVFNSTFVRQMSPPAEGAYIKTCLFEECSSAEDPRTMFDGHGLGFEPARVEGLHRAGTRGTRSPAHQCLRAILKPFFPTRVGEGRQLQVRRYIRSSALGRGVLPSGAPSISDLLQTLEAEGFTTGGRNAHIYAPWSSVAGGGDVDIARRNELMEYMKNGRVTLIVERMIARINQAAEWSGVVYDR